MLDDTPENASEESLDEAVETSEINETDESGQLAEPDDHDDESEGESDDDEVVVSLDDQELNTPEKQPAPQWVKDMRKELKQLKREKREWMQKQESAPAQDAIPELRAKPKLDDKDIDYDADKYDAAIERWYDDKRKRDEIVAKKQKEQEEINRQWQTKLEAYGKSKAALKVRDFDEAEETIMQHFTPQQQAIIISASGNPALLIYAVGKDAAKTKEFAGITDLAKFTWKMAQLETKLKVTKKTPPEPEKRVTGSGSLSGTVDATLERLRKDAEKTGDYSKVLAYKRSKKK